jgi:putative two-component system response regulator
MAIADVYDALVSERPYKKPFSAEEAVKIIMEGSGTQFDPMIADVFYSVKNRFEAVRV